MNQIALFQKFFKRYQNWFCVNRDGTILEVGDNFHSILSEAEVGSNIKELFPQEKNSNTFDFLNNNAEANEKVLRISIDDNRSLKCSWFREDEIFLVVFNPVLNSRNSLKAYNLYHSDFLPQDQILEYSFLLETTNASAADAQRLIQNLSKSRKEISDTKTFYEKILSELPVEMGVFDTEQRYLFVNKTGVNDPEMRSFMRGKTDFDYCKKRGVDKSFAINRKEKFDEAIRTKQKVDWIDDYQNTRTGKRSIVRRTYFPIIDDENTISVVIGYGVDITEEIKKEESKTESEKRYRELFENNLAGVFRTNLSGDFIDVNDAYASLYGFESIAELLNYQSRDFYVSPNDRKNYLSALIEKGSLSNYAMRQKDKNGNTLFVSINVKFDAPSKTIFGTIVDQTEIAEKSSQIEKINAELENILTYVDKSSDAIMVTDEKGVFRYVNKTAQIRYGIDDLSESKTHIWDVQVKQFSREDLANHFHELQSKKKLTQRTQHKNIKTGEILQVELNVSLHIAKTGERFIIASARDISYTIEKENEILAINRSLEETVQNEIRKNLTLTSSISKQEKFSVIGEIAAGISHDLRTPLTTMKLGANNIELIIQEIFRILTTELNQQDVQLAFDAYQNLINEELFVGGMQLLKDKKNLLEFLAQKYPEYSETELSKLANSFSKARLTLQKSNLIEEIMNTAQPLNISELIFNLKAIMLFNEGISQSAEKSLAVIGNLNSFIKSEEATKGTVNLSESIRNALDVLKYVTPENITIDNELDNNIELEAYPSQLFQIWLNIIRNAIEAIGEKDDGKISILTTHDETYGIIRITNNGPKVPDDVVDNIFNQFYTTKSSQGGSGLGLSVVKKVVESHYGQIELINKDNNVTFIIRLKSKHA